MGKKAVEAWGFDSPPQFRRRVPAGVGAAAMVAADDCGHGRREQGRLGVSRHGAKGEREGRNPVRPLPWAGATRRSGATGAAAAALVAHGGSAGAREEGWLVMVAVVELGGLFIARERRWGSSAAVAVWRNAGGGRRAVRPR